MVAPVIALIGPLLSTIAPQFLRNLSDPNHGEQFAQQVKIFVDRNVTPINNPQDVTVAIDKLQKNPVLTEHMLETLLDSERDLTDKHLADLKDARQLRSGGTDSKQAQTLLWISFSLLIIIMLFVVGTLYYPIKTTSENKDFLIQIAGTAIGFLTGIGGMFARNIGSAFDFWFGSSAGSKAKGDQIGQLLEKGPPTPGPAAPLQAANQPAEAAKPAPVATVPPAADVSARLSAFQLKMAAPA